MQGQGNEGTVGADSGVSEGVGIGGGFRGGRKMDEKKLIIALAVACLVVISTGVGVWIWKRGEGETKEKGEEIVLEEGEVVFLGMLPDEKNERKAAMWAAYDEAKDSISNVANENGALIINDEGEDTYDYEKAENNIDDYLSGITDATKKSRETILAVDVLSGIGDTEGAKRMMDKVETRDFSEIEWFCYYQAASKYYSEIGDKENAKMNADLLKEVVVKTMEGE